jgi:hypothetical protein
VAVKNVSGGTLAATMTYYAGTNIKGVSVSGICPTECPAGSTFSIEISNVLNPSNIKPIETLISVQTMTSTRMIIDQGDVNSVPTGLALIPGTFTTISLVQPSGVIKVGTSYQTKITVTPKNMIPGEGFIILQLPSDLFLSTGSTCIALSSESAHTCTVNATGQKISIKTQTSVITATTVDILTIRVPQT